MTDIWSELKAKLLSTSLDELTCPLDREVAEMFLDEKIRDEFSLGCFGGDKHG